MYDNLQLAPLCSYFSLKLNFTVAIVIRWSLDIHINIIVS